MADDPTTDAFQTVAGHGHASFEVRGSAFIGHVTPVDTVDEAEVLLDRLRSATGR